MRTLLLLVFSMFSAAVPAALVTVANPDFEATTPLPFGQPVIGFWGWDNLPGWRSTVARNAGIWRQGTAPTLAPLDGGTQSAWLGIAAGTIAAIEQDLAEVVRAGTRYDLSVYIGDRSDTPLGSPDGTPANARGGSVSLLSVTGEIFASEVFAGDFVQNGWRELRLGFTPDAADLGKQLRIRLQSAGIQVNFDNVSLSATSVPLPGALGLLAGALVATPRFRRRARR